MRRLYAWITGAAGGMAAYRLFRRQAEQIAEHGDAPLPGADPRAEELRAKLAVARADDPVSPPDEPVAEESPEERRRRVHEQARGAIDEMQGGG